MRALATRESPRGAFCAAQAVRTGLAVLPAPFMYRIDRPRRLAGRFAAFIACFSCPCVLVCMHQCVPTQAQDDGSAVREVRQHVQHATRRRMWSW